MIISVLQHGLGNQLFQYAAGRALAQRLQTRLLLDDSSFAYNSSRTLDLANLRIQSGFAPEFLAKLLTPTAQRDRVKTLIKSLAARAIPTLTDVEKGYDARILEVRGSCRLDGFWQNERYFSHLRPELLEELEPRDKLLPAHQALAQRMADGNSIAVHVRRGDLVNVRRYVETIGALTSGFYRNALARLKTCFTEAQVYLFSDDPAWCQENISPVFPMEIVSGNVTHSAIEDLTLMKHCRHFVIANSTFGWWAAWLGNHPSKKVIAPSRFHRVPRDWEKGLLPESWETIEAVFEPAIERGGE